MRATPSVQTFFGYAKALHRAASDQMLGDDGFGVRWSDVPIPDGLGIDHNHGTVLALVKTAGFVDTHPASESGIFGQLLQARVQFAFSVAGTGRPRRFKRPEVVADEDMAFKLGQRGTSKAIPFRLKPGQSRGEVSTITRQTRPHLRE